MDKKKTLTILKSVAIVLIIVFFAFLLRANAYNLSIIPEEQKSMFIDSNGLPYFSEMDSYYNLRMTQDLLSHGHFGDSIKDGEPWDMHRYAPYGTHTEYEPMIAYVTIFLYHLANIFSDMSLKEVAFWASAIIAPLAAIPAYIFVRRITNDYGGITAALLTSLAPSYFGHTFAGFFDTDMFAVFFPIFIVLFFVESIRNDKLIYRIIFALLSLASMLLFSLSWNGYIFYGAVLVIFVIVYFIASFLMKVDIIKPIKDYPNKLTWFTNQREIFSILLISIVGFTAVIITGNLESTINSSMGLIGATQLQASLDVTLGSYPNVLISVGELQAVNLLVGGIQGAFLSTQGGVINAIGGIVAFFGALIILFIFAQRLWNLRSIRVGSNNKKLPKTQRKIISKSDNSHGTFVESIFSDSNTIDQIDKSKRENLLYLCLFVVWIGLLVVALTQGSRFLREFAIPLGLVTGIFVGYAVMYIKNKVDKNTILIAISIIGAFLVAYPIYNTATLGETYGIVSFLIIAIFAAIAIYGTKNISSNSKIKKTAVMMIITLAFVAPTVTGAYQSSVYTVPGTSDPMWDSMTWIEENTTNDAVVSSWWDFGYIFQIAANRSTLFDGGYQNTPRAFWVGKAMMTTDMDLSAGIFTMLATSGDGAFETLDEYTNNTGKTVEILEKTLPVSKEEAKTIMVDEYNLTSTQADTILNLSHPDNPRPVIFVASSDMLHKAYWWTYFGNWDFESKTSEGYNYLVYTAPAKMENISGGRQQANITNLQTSFGTIPVLYQTILTKGSDNNTTNVSFEAKYANGSEITYPNGTVFEPMLGNETVKINKFFLVENEILMKNETIDEDGQYALFVFGYDGIYISYLMSKELENSMFTKLFILGGFGQDSYEGVHRENGVLLFKIRGSE